MPDRTNNETLAVIRRRRSVRSYTAAQITDDELAVIVEAGMYAPTLIVVSAPVHRPTPQVDCAAATENMLIAAGSLGLGTCWLFYITLAFRSTRA